MIEWVGNQLDKLDGSPLWLELVLLILGCFGFFLAVFLMIVAFAGLFWLWEKTVDFVRKLLGLPLNNWWN